MDRAFSAEARTRRARAAARRRDDPLEASLAHPAFAPVRPWLERLPAPPEASLELLNGFAEESGLRVESGKPVRFVRPPAGQARYGDYELRVFRSGHVETRPGNRHDFFNALAWLAFPRTKARLNALHAALIPLEGGRRGRFRDLLTLLDEGGVIVECDDPLLEEMVRGFRWKELFWDCREAVLRSMRLHVLGHAVLEQALQARPGITCKAIFLRDDGKAGAETDGRVAAWLGALPRTATPRDLPPLPVFGYPGWLEGSSEAAFYEDTRYFRPSTARRTGKSIAGSMPSR